jgi:hypothetical protein
MGKHTAYWQQYQRNHARGVLKRLLTIVAWIFVIVSLVEAQSVLDGAFTWLVGPAFAGLVLSVLMQRRDMYNVLCPECSFRYRRNKWGGQCPSCGLKLFQHDP